MLPEYVAYLAAQRREEAVARGALPDAPVAPPEQSRTPGGRLIGFRARLCADLRRLADRIEHGPRRYAPASAHRR